MTKRGDGQYRAKKMYGKIQDMCLQRQFYAEIDSNANGNTYHVYVKQQIYNFLQSPGEKADSRVSAMITKQLLSDFKNIFTGTGYSEGIFSLQMKADSKPYQALPR